MSTEELIKAIKSYYSDTSRSRAETLSGLQDAQDEIETLIDTLAGEDAE